MILRRLRTEVAEEAQRTQKKDYLRVLCVPLNKGGRGLFLCVLCGFKSLKTFLKDA